MAEMLADELLQRRSSSSDRRGSPTRSRCPDRGHASDADLRITHISTTHRDPRGTPPTHACRLLGSRSSTRGIFHEFSSSSRSTPTSGSSLSSRSISTTSTPPSRNSRPGTSPAKPPSTRARGRPSRPATRRLTDASSPATTANFGDDHRRGDLGARADSPYLRRVGSRPRPQVSTSRQSIGRTISERSSPRGTWHFAGRLRRRVARDRNLLTVEGDMINRVELFDEADLDAAIARFEELHPPDPATRKRRKVEHRFAPRGTLRSPRLGRDRARYWPTTTPSDDRRHRHRCRDSDGRADEIANMRAHSRPRPHGRNVGRDLPSAANGSTLTRLLHGRDH